MARRMICEWGMNDSLGPLRYSEGDSNPFLQASSGRAARPHSEQIAQKIDEEMRKLINGQYQLAVDLLRDNRDLLDLMAEALLEFEAIDQQDMKVLLAERDLEPLREHRRKQERARVEDSDKSPKTGFSSKIKDQIGDLAPSSPLADGPAF
jgi:cell division protease FtsH